MKICYFIASSGYGGAEYVLVDLVNYLSKKTKHDIYIVVPKNSIYIDKVDKNINIIEYKFQSRINIMTYIELFIKINKIKPDIIHTHSAKASYIIYYLSKINRLPFLATKNNPRRGRIFNKIKYVSVISKEIQDTVFHKTYLVYNGLVPNYSNISDIPTLKDFTILAIGRLDAIKGFDILIQECSKLNINYHLNIIGDGVEVNNLQKIIKDLKLEKQVSLLGFRSDIPYQISNSNLVVVSSHSEGFSSIAVESLYYANLLISTKVGGPVEFLSDRLLIDKFNIADKINEIYNNYEKYKVEFNAIKKIYQKKFTLENTVNQYLKIYKEILNG